jgi:hypothetical protein
VGFVVALAVVLILRMTDAVNKCLPPHRRSIVLVRTRASKELLVLSSSSMLNNAQSATTRFCTQGTPV